MDANHPTVHLYLTNLLSRCFSFLFQKGVKFKEEVNEYLRRLDDSGLLDWWISQSLVNADKCDTRSKIIESHKRENVSLRLNETSTFFLILATGHALAAMVFLAELSFKRGRGKFGDRETYMGYPL